MRIVISIATALALCVSTLAAEEKTDLVKSFADTVDISLLIEAEASCESAGDTDAGDIALATFELGLDAVINEMVSASATMLWEENDTEPIDLDCAVITLGGTDDIPVSLTMGKLYAPFGAYESYFVSDPLVLEMGEARESAALVSVPLGIAQFQAGAFNGDLDEEGEDDDVGDFFASASLAPTEGMLLGVSWISDIGEGDVLEEAITGFAETSATNTLPAPAYEKEAGFAAYAYAELGCFCIKCEYMSALDDYQAGTLSDSTVKPNAWNAELAYAATEKIELAAKMEGSDDFLDFPETQYGACVGYALNGNTTVSLEYLRGEFEGSDDDRDLATLQVAVEL